MNTLAAKRSREPADYSRTDHFGECFDDPLRFIEEWMVDEVLITGRDYPDEGGPGKFRRKKEYDGVDAVLVVAEDSPVLVTGWTEVRSWVRAMRSDRWDTAQLESIRAFEDREHKSAGWGR